MVLVGGGYLNSTANPLPLPPAPLDSRMPLFLMVHHNIDVTLKASFGDCFAPSHSKLQTKENEELCPQKVQSVVVHSRTITKSECIIVSHKS